MGNSARNLSGIRGKSNSSGASKRYAETNQLPDKSQVNNQQYVQVDNEETCSATLSDYFDITQERKDNKNDNT